MFLCSHTHTLSLTHSLTFVVLVRSFWQVFGFARVFFDDNWVDETPLFRVKDLCFGSTIQGPALLIEDLSTIVVERGCSASITRHGDVDVVIGSGQPRFESPEKSRASLSLVLSLMRFVFLCPLLQESDHGPGLHPSFGVWPPFHEHCRTNVRVVRSLPSNNPKDLHNSVFTGVAHSSALLSPPTSR
jgi:hypothetical protein